jgi:soluble lytic murein transglycosylase-like protein
MTLLTLAAALVLSAHAQAAPAARLNAGAKTEPAPQYSAPQKELLASMAHWALLCRPDSADPAMRGLAARLGALRQRVDQPLDNGQLSSVHNDFEAWKSDLSKLLYASSDRKLDEAAFRGDLEKGVHALSVIAEDSHVSAQDLKKVKAQMGTLKRAVGPVAASYYFDRARSQGGVGVLAAARSQGTAGAEKIFANYQFRGYTGTPRVLNPSQSGSVPLQYVDYKPETASGWSLKGLISSVSSTARRYAGKVADSIVNFSRKYGVDERLQTALVWVESHFNPGATSGAGAMGLGQLMPGTAAGLGVRNSYDIDQNLRGSASYLKSLLNQFSNANEMRYTQGLYAWGKNRVQSGQSEDAVWQDIFAKTPLGIKNAIAAYNAGGGAVRYYAHNDYRNLIRVGKGYAETINYVPAVLRRYFDVYLKTPTDKGGPQLFSI